MAVSRAPAGIDPGILIADPARLHALRQTELLDTPPEADFDRLTRLAARLTGAPVTFISLVDADRDFYKSYCGFGEPLATDRELQGRTFCHYALSSDGPLVIEDTTLDPVHAAVPTVQSLGVRAYVGIPLKVDSGQVIGSFCAIDFVPRTWSASDLDVLIELAHATAREIHLRQLAREADNSACKAREIARERQEVLAAVAHDLRTPLHVIDMTLQALDRLPASERPAAVERARRASRSMTEMVGDLLENSRLQDGGLNLQLASIDAASLLQDACEMLIPLATRRGIKLVTRAEADAGHVQADYQRMLRVFANLVGNAIKFSPSGSTIELALECDTPWCRFIVADQGSGIAAEDLPFLFDRFWQGADRDARGTGLGLSIARSIVADHGGEIGVHSVLNQGSRFHFSLPMSPPAAG